MKDGISTERLTLTRFTGSDAEIRDMLRNWVSDPAVQSEYGEPVYTTEAAVRCLLNRYMSEPFRWAIQENSSRQCIGQVAFCRIWEATSIVIMGRHDLSVLKEILKRC